MLIEDNFHTEKILLFLFSFIEHVVLTFIYIVQIYFSEYSSLKVHTCINILTSINIYIVNKLYRFVVARRLSHHNL